MALSQKGAGYRNRDQIVQKDRLLGDAMDDLADQVQSALNQGNFGKAGPSSPPSTPTAVNASAKGGQFTVQIVHPNAPAGTQWHLQYSASANFSSPIDVGLLHPVWQGYFPGQTMYFRVRAKFPASTETPWVYVGSSVAPTAVN